MQHGDLLAKLGRYDEARTEFERAASMTRNIRERALNGPSSVKWKRPRLWAFWCEQVWGLPSFPVAKGMNQRSMPCCISMVRIIDAPFPYFGEKPVIYLPPPRSFNVSF
jgi:hypothetical protein